MNSKNITTRARMHMQRIREMGCIVCDQPGPSEAHHIRQGDHFTSPCAGLHTGSHNGIHGRQSIWKVLRLDELAALNNHGEADLTVYGLPIKTVTGLNARSTAGSPQARKRNATQPHRAPFTTPPWSLHAPVTGSCDDDNLQGAMKAIRDEVARSPEWMTGTGPIRWGTRRRSASTNIRRAG